MWSTRPCPLVHRLESLCHQSTAGRGGSTFFFLPHLAGTVNPHRRDACATKICLVT